MKVLVESLKVNQSKESQDDRDDNRGRRTMGVGLDNEQSEQLLSFLSGIEMLLSATDQDGAEEILDGLYELLTKIYARFPEIDIAEED